MSGERMTTPDEFETMHQGLMGAIDALEAYGVSRGQIGVAMIGVGLALVQVHLGAQSAEKSLRSAMEAVDRQKAEEASKH